jgi:hypothetical protein
MVRVAEMRRRLAHVRDGGWLRRDAGRSGPRVYGAGGGERQGEPKGREDSCLCHGRLHCNPLKGSHRRPDIPRCTLDHAGFKKREIACPRS